MHANYTLQACTVQICYTLIIQYFVTVHIIPPISSKLISQTCHIAIASNWSDVCSTIHNQNTSSFLKEQPVTPPYLINAKYPWHLLLYYSTFNETWKVTYILKGTQDWCLPFMLWYMNYSIYNLFRITCIETFDIAKWANITVGNVLPQTERASIKSFNFQDDIFLRFSHNGIGCIL